MRTGVTRGALASATLAALAAAGALLVTGVGDSAEPKGVAGPGAGVAEAQARASVPIDVYLRRWQGTPPDVKIDVGAPRPSPIPGLEVVPVTFARGGRIQEGEVLRSAAGRYLLAGPLLDLAEDPHAPPGGPARARGAGEPRPARRAGHGG